MLALAACSSSNNNKNKSFNLQVLHASPDAPLVSVLVDGDVVLTDFDYKDGSGYVVLDEGTYSIQVNGILPGGEVPVIGPVDLTFDRDMTYTIAAVNSVASIEPVVISQSSENVSAGAARVLVLHAAADAPAVDVYVTAPGADLAASAPVGTFSFKEQIGPAEVPAGDYQIRVTAAGNAAAVVFDSGTINLADADDIVLAAPYLAHVHLKDKAGENQEWNFPGVGEGYIDFAAVLALLEGVGYTAPFSVEIEFQGEPWPPLAEVDRANNLDVLAIFLSNYR